MGFDTYLEVGDRTVVMWRKQTGDLPRLLFPRDAFEVDCDAEGAEISALEFRSPALKTLATLEANGFGWHASVSAYGAIRSGAVSEAMLTGQYWVEAETAGVVGEAVDTYVSERLGAERRYGAADDLEHFGRLLASQWQDPTRDEVLLFKEFLYDDPIEATASLIGQAIMAARAAGVPMLPVARAMETLVLLFREARLIAWPLLMCTLIRHLPATTDVRYVLTEGQYEFGIDDVSSAENFIDEYWEQSGESLADYAEKLGLLYSALAQFQNGLGPQFAFGQATAALARLDDLNSDRITSSKKARGDALEDLVDALIRTEAPELCVLTKNYRTDEEELDLILTNGLAHPFWTAQGSPIILVECKNWKDPVGVQDLRVFESKLEDRRGLARIGLFVSMSGYTAPFQTRLKTIQSRDVGVIFAITGDDLRESIGRRRRLTEWLRAEGAVRAFATS